MVLLIILYMCGEVLALNLTGTVLDLLLELVVYVVTLCIDTVS